MGAARKKHGVQGMVERGGRVRTKVIESNTERELVGNMAESVDRKATIMTDQLRSYQNLTRRGYDHWVINHGEGHYAIGSVSTNTIEGFWGQLKRSVNGTYHAVSLKHLPGYLDEFAWRYSHRHSQVPLFALLTAKAAQPAKAV